jgi:hypothetical protein
MNAWPRHGQSEKLHANLARIEELSQRLIAALARASSAHDPALQGPPQDLPEGRHRL